MTGLERVKGRNKLRKELAVNGLITIFDSRKGVMQICKRDTNTTDIYVVGEITDDNDAIFYKGDK